MFYELSPHTFMEISPSKFCLSINAVDNSQKISNGKASVSAFEDRYMVHILDKNKLQDSH